MLCDAICVVCGGLVEMGEITARKLQAPYLILRPVHQKHGVHEVFLFLDVCPMQLTTSNTTQDIMF